MVSVLRQTVGFIELDADTAWDEGSVFRREHVVSFAADLDRLKADLVEEWQRLSIQWAVCSARGRRF
jgi:hypothetical protein